MYKLTIDCGTAVDLIQLKDEDSVREYIVGLEEYDESVTENLLEYGVIHCGIDTITLEKVFETYEIDKGSILKRKRGGDFRVVTGIGVDKDGTTVVCSYEFYFDKAGKMVYDYETFAACALSNIYRHYSPIGEDFKLFTKE